MGWCLLQQYPWSNYWSWILPLCTEMCAGLHQHTPPVTETLLQNIHLGQNNCEGGLLGADRGSWEGAVWIWAPLPVSTPTSEHLSDPKYVPSFVCFAAQGLRWCVVSSLLLWMMMLSVQPCWAPANTLLWLCPWHLMHVLAGFPSY